MDEFKSTKDTIQADDSESESKEDRNMFSNVLNILMNKLCHQLLKIETSSKISTVSLEKIGNVFVVFSRPNVFQAYSEHINNLQKSIDLVENESKHNQPLTDLLKQNQQAAADQMNICGLLLKPVQRFPQLILILKNLLKGADTAKGYKVVNARFRGLKSECAGVVSLAMALDKKKYGSSLNAKISKEKVSRLFVSNVHKNTDNEKEAFDVKDCSLKDRTQRKYNSKNVNKSKVLARTQCTTKTVILRSRSTMVLNPRPRAATILISEVSDATEIKSLSENPTGSDRLGCRKSKQWKDRVLTNSGKVKNSRVLVQDNSSLRARRERQRQRDRER